MIVYSFRSEKDAGVFGFSIDKAGKNLPREFSPWTFQNDIGDLRGTDQGRVALDAAAAAQAIATDGFYLQRVDIRVRRAS
jgi:hypothetical protein